MSRSMTWAFTVEVLAAYSHSAQAVDLRLATPWLSPVLWVPQDRARSVRGACATASIARHRRPEHRLSRNATAASRAAAHSLSLTSVERLPTHHRCPPDLTHSTSYEGDADRDASVASHARRSPHTTA
jgi:hypothetical protein